MFGDAVGFKFPVFLQVFAPRTRHLPLPSLRNRQIGAHLRAHRFAGMRREIDAGLGLP